MDANEARLVEYLRGKTDLFLGARSAFGIGNALGYGSLTTIPIPYTTACVADIRCEEGEVKVPHMRNTIIGPVIKYREMTEEDGERIFIFPEMNGTGHIVSVYPRMGPGERQRMEEKLLTAPEAVVEGIFAHEMAEYLKLTGTLHPFSEQLPQLLTRFDDIRGQTEPDVLATLFGYRDQLISSFKYDMERLATYDEGPFMASMTPEEVMQQVRRRMEVVSSI